MNEDTQHNTQGAGVSETPQNTPSQTPPTPPEQETPNTMKDTTPDDNSYGPLVGVIVIILVLLAGGYYFWTATVNEIREEDQLPTIQSGGETDAIVNQLESQGTSDEISAIESDLNSTEFESLDAELDDIFSEFQ